MDTEPERLLPLLTTESARTLPFIADFLLPYLRREADAGRLRPGIDLDRARFGWDGNLDLDVAAQRPAHHLL